MYIDIKQKNYTNERKMNKRTDPSQILNSKHPQNVKEYKDIILKELEKPRMKHLVDSIKKKLTTKDIQTINKLDTPFHRIQIDAESQLQTHKHNNAPWSPWSPKLDQAHLLSQYWENIRDQTIHKKDTHNCLENIRSKIKIQPPEITEIKQLEENLQKAIDHLQQI